MDGRRSRLVQIMKGPFVKRRRGKYQIRMAQGAADLAECQRLRMRAFKRRDGRDSDLFDDLCIHVMVEDTAAEALVGCFRILPLPDGRQIEASYSAQYYELSKLRAFRGKMVEMGRFCVDPGTTDPDILRMVWGALTRYVDENDVEMLFGCTSFSGTTPESYSDAFALLKDKHLAPSQWLPRIKAPECFAFAKFLHRRKPDLKQAMLAMPPLLRSYLTLGGWVSDHAVVDRDMNTLHVFTGLEIRAIPAARKRLLRAVAL